MLRDLDIPGGPLWAMIVAPTIWAVHFLFCYLLAAVYCAKAGLAADLEPVRIAIAAFTVLALGAIAACAIEAYRLGGFAGGNTAPHDADTIHGRRRFLAYATLLLSALSFVATVFVALPAVFFVSCR